jgi:hypothetical protein
MVLILVFVFKFALMEPEANEPPLFGGLMRRYQALHLLNDAV